LVGQTLLDDRMLLDEKCRLAGGLAAVDLAR
jgi:hypothetical protein